MRSLLVSIGHWQDLIAARRKPRDFLVNVIHNFIITTFDVSADSGNQIRSLPKHYLKSRLHHLILFIISTITLVPLLPFSSRPMDSCLHFLIKIAFLDPTRADVHRWIFLVALIGLKPENIWLVARLMSFTMCLAPVIKFMLVSSLLPFSLGLNLVYMAFNV